MPCTPPNAWLSDWGAVYAAQESNGKTGTTELAPLPAGTAVYYGDDLMGSDFWSWHSAVVFGRCALVLAVDHGVLGAAEGYARIKAASNYSEAGFATTPIWGIVPR